MKPEAVVQHEAQETLLGASLMVAVTTYSAAILAAHVAGQRKRHLVQPSVRIVVILHLDAVVGVDAFAVWNEQVILTNCVVIGNNVQLVRRRPFHLTPDPRRVIGRTVRLPSVDEPRLNLQ